MPCSRTTTGAATTRTRSASTCSEAAEAAKASYANKAAIDYYERLLTVVEDNDRIDVQLRIGEVLELTGDWPRATATLGSALEAAVSVGDEIRQAWVYTTLAGVERKQGNLEKAGRDLVEAEALFRAHDDDVGLGQVLHLGGTLAAQQGDLETARERYQESIKIRERVSDRAKVGSLYSNLAVVAEYDGDLAEARRLAELALEVREEVGDAWGVGVSQTNLGAISNKEHQFENASRHLDEAIRVMRQIGDLWFVASALQLRGVAARGLGDIPGARELFAEALQTFADLDDEATVAEVFEDIAVLATQCEQHVEAIELVEAAAHLRDEVGTPLTPSLEAGVRAELAPSVAAVGDAEADAAAGRGRGLNAESAVTFAMGVLRPVDTVGKP